MALLRLLLAAAALTYVRAHGPSVLEFEIDLDKKPEDRYIEVINHFNDTLWDFYSVYFNHHGIKAVIEDLSKKRGPEVAELQGEIDGVAKLTGLPAWGIHFVQMLYEFNTLPMVPIVNFTLPWKGPACTGILAVNKEDGMVYHARNLDFSPADQFQRLVYTANIRKGGKELYKSQMVAGYSLPVTSMKPGPNGFSLELNTRFPVHHEGGPDAVWHNLFTEKRPFNGWVVRKVLETANGYEEAVEALSTTPYCTTEYTIIGGVRKGTILARSPDGLAHKLTLGEENTQCREDYIIVTNFDYWDHDVREWFDPTGGKGIGHPRRQAATKMLNSTPVLTPEVLYNVVSSFEVQAKDTIFRSIMNVESGLWNVSLPACANCKQRQEPSSNEVVIV